MNNGTQILSGRLARKAIAATVLAAAVAFAPTVQADPITDDFVATNGWRVCVELDNAPTFDGIRYAFKALVARGYTLDQSADIIVRSVGAWCTRHTPLLKSYVNTYAPNLQQQSGGRTA